MIAKITGGKSIYGALKYNQLKTENGKAKIILQNNMFESPANRFDMSLCLRSFEPYLIANRRTKNPVIHISLNPDPRDKVTDEKLSEMAEKYMAEMGYGNQPYIVFKHSDIDREHLHIVSIRVDENGRKIKSDFEHRHSMEVCRKLEQEYSLHVAGKEQRTDVSELKKIDYQRGDIKHQVGNIVKYLFDNYQFQSFGEFRTLLELFNVTVEEVKGAIYDKPYQGLLYVATDDNGKRIGTPFKSSLFGKSVGYDALQRKFGQSAQTIKDKQLREKLYPVVRQAMNQAKDKEDFTLLMKEKGIGVIFRQNENGRIYGVTFIDHKNQTILNGSRLGKEFSANAFNERFRENSYNKGQVSTNENKDWNYQQVHSNIQQPNTIETQTSNQETSFGGLFTVPSSPISDYYNPVWLEELKKRKKKRGRRL